MLSKLSLSCFGVSLDEIVGFGKSLKAGGEDMLRDLLALLAFLTGNSRRRRIHRPQEKTLDVD